MKVSNNLEYLRIQPPCIPCVRRLYGYRPTTLYLEADAYPR